MNVACAGSFWSSNFCSFSTHESTTVAMSFVSTAWTIVGTSFFV